MLTVVTGVYENGNIILESTPKNIKKAKVVVVFEDESNIAISKNKKRPFGISKGSIKLSPDFNSPLDDLQDYM